MFLTKNLRKLVFCLQSFLQLLKTWQKDIYSANTIVNTVISHIKSYQEKLTKEHVKLLYECLAILYTNQSNYVEALSVYLKYAFRFNLKLPFFYKNGRKMPII